MSNEKNGVRFNENYPDITRSNELYESAKKIMTPVSQTLAKGPGQYVKGVAPKYLKRGKGSHVWDVDGNEYIDYNMGIGPISLGYCYDKVDDAIRAQLNDGITFSLMHEYEAKFAELIREIIPNAESIRISKTGCDVTTAAVRIARAFTGRDKVLCCGYHGWHDWYVGTTDRHAGIPESTRELTSTFQYNDLESVREGLDADVACVILEPVAFEEPRDGFLAALCERCKRNGSLLIFDEMWTGFRASVGGAQEYYGVVPDLSTFSKAVANGMPLSILAGRQDVLALLDRDVFFFTTFGGEALSLAAAQATLTELVAQSVPAHLARQGQRIKDTYNRIARDLGIDALTRCVGPAWRTLVTFDRAAGDPLELKSLVQQELIRRGILWSGTHVVSFAHSDTDVAELEAAYGEVLEILRDAIQAGTARRLLQGTPVEPVFRRTGQFNTKPRPARATGTDLFSLEGRTAVVTGAADSSDASTPWPWPRPVRTWSSSTSRKAPSRRSRPSSSPRRRARSFPSRPMSRTP